MGKKKYNYPTSEIVDGKYRHTKCYKVWDAMMTRCYNTKSLEKNPTYMGCSVCTEWHDFDNFYIWFQDNYKYGYQLDKDILIQGNKIYSPSTCVFLPQYINLLLCNSYAARGTYPIGVYFNKKRNIFTAQLNINGRKKHLGVFTDALTAHQAYCDAKYAYIKETASNALKIGDINQQTYNALLAHKIEMY